MTKFKCTSTSSPLRTRIMNKNLSGNYEANIARSPIWMLMPQSIMNCTDLALFVSVTVNTFNSPSLSTGSLIFLLLYAAYAKNAISLSSVLLSIARPNLPVQQTTIMVIVVKKQWRKNAIKIDAIDWGCGKLLPKTKETFILVDERMLKVLEILSLSICSSTIFFDAQFVFVAVVVTVADVFRSFDTWFIFIERWKTGTKLLFFKMRR